MVNKRAVSLVAGITLAVLIVIAPAIGISTLHAFLLVGVLGSVGLIVYSAVCAVRSFLQGESVDGSAALDSLLTEKKVLLRNIREIEFDQRLSKISEKEAKALLGPLRGRAKRCLQRIDELRASTSVLILIVGVLAYGEADRCFIAWAQSGPPAAMLPMMVQRVLPKADIPVGTLKLRVIGASFGEKISGLSVRVESADTDRPNAGQADQRVEQTGKTSDAGEVLIKGPAVFSEYYKNPEATAESFTEDGYFRTGDKADMDTDGYLCITGRVKDIFKSGKGKYIAPVPIESKLAANMLIEQLCVMGSGLPTAMAVIVLSKEVTSGMSNNDIDSSLLETVKEVNGQIEKHEVIGGIRIVKDAWTIENGLLTPTMKVKRAELEEKYLPTLEGQQEAIVWES